MGEYADTVYYGGLSAFGKKDTRTAREKAISQLEWRNASNYL